MPFYSLRPIALSAALLFTFLNFAEGSEADALAISANIQARHMPFGTILDPVFSSSTTTTITGYTRCGDSALWTGAYLAAEAFRYKVTGTADALANVRAALAGLKSLVDVTGDNRLARCIVNASSPYAAGIESEEAHNTVHSSPPWVWLDNTSRDEMVGAFFGLGIAYDLVADATVKSTISDLCTRMMQFVANHQWSPNDDISNTFQLRPEELQMMLNVTRHVNPATGITGPFLEVPQDSAVSVDVSSDSSYFKFNLDYMSYYNLLRLDPNSSYKSGYTIVRNHTAGQVNAFFDAIDLGINGPNATRDAEMRSLLDQWLQRPRRDFYVNLTNNVAVCNGQACQPIPVPLRTPADFLWQVSPYQLMGGASGTIENASIDYILPYWMGRYYGAIAPDGTQSFAVQSAGAALSVVAPEELASIYALNGSLPAQTATAVAQPLPTLLGGATVTVTDAGGTARQAPLLYASSNQINFQVPKGTPPGTVTVAVSNGSTTLSGTANVQNVAPTLFSMNGAGTGVAAATAIRTQASNPSLQTPVAVFQCSGQPQVCASTPISLGVDTPVYLTLYATGVRNRGSLATVLVSIKGTNVPVLYAGAAPGFTGLDQVNVALPVSLKGSGEVNVVLTVDGQISNTVTINIQ